MNSTIIILIIIGVICIVVSFVMTGREFDNTNKGDVKSVPRDVITEQYEFNEQELELIHSKVEDRIHEIAEQRIVQTDDVLATMTNEKMMAIGDYAVTVCDEIEKNHKEVMFLYSMLNDKEKELKSLIVEADSQIKKMKKANEQMLQDFIGTDPEFAGLDDTKLDLSDETSITNDIHNQFESENDFAIENNTNDIILEMHKSGMSILEIAKQLGLGVGEVKLVVNLYQGDKA